MTVGFVSQFYAPHLHIMTFNLCYYLHLRTKNSSRWLITVLQSCFYSSLNTCYVLAKGVSVCHFLLSFTKIQFGLQKKKTEDENLIEFAFF